MKRTIAIVSTGTPCRILPQRSYHVCTALQAKSRPSPRVRASKSRGLAAPVQKTPSAGTVFSVPSIGSLESMREDGILEMPPKQAQDFLLRYMDLEPNPTPGWERELCDEFNIKPSVVIPLALILMSNHSVGQRALGNRLLASLSHMGEIRATCHILVGFMYSEEPEHPTSKRVLEKVIHAAKEGNPMAQAVLGKYFLSRDKTSDALSWLHKATSTENPEVALEFFGAGAAFSDLGVALFRSGDKRACKKALQRAAFEFDHPLGWHYLSQTARWDGDHSSRHAYLLKAASGGIPDAYWFLGNNHIDRHFQQKNRRAAIVEIERAREWYEIGAVAGSWPCMVRLAMVYKLLGQLKEALEWVKKAEAFPEAATKIKKLREFWDKPDYELLKNSTQFVPIIDIF